MRRRPLRPENVKLSGLTAVVGQAALSCQMSCWCRCLRFVRPVGTLQVARRWWRGCKGSPRSGILKEQHCRFVCLHKGPYEDAVGGKLLVGGARSYSKVGCPLFWAFSSAVTLAARSLGGCTGDATPASIPEGILVQFNYFVRTYFFVHLRCLPRHKRGLPS